MTFHSVVTVVDAEYSGLRNVEPMFSRVPYEDWSRLFRDTCDADPSLNFVGAGYARCEETEVASVIEQLERHTATTNQRFRAFLEKVLHRTPEDGRDLISIEASLGASEDGKGHPGGFRTGV